MIGLLAKVSQLLRQYVSLFSLIPVKMDMVLLFEDQSMSFLCTKQFHMIHPPIPFQVQGPVHLNYAIRHYLNRNTFLPK